MNAKSMVLVDQWKKLSHSNLVSLREVFTTKAFNDNCKYLINIPTNANIFFAPRGFSFGTNQNIFKTAVVGFMYFVRENADSRMMIHS